MRSARFPRPKVYLASLALVAASTTVLAAAAAPSVPEDVIAQAQRLGATEVETRRDPVGGMTLTGKLDGNRFAVAFPPDWNGEVVLYAHGYSLPGSSVAVSAQPGGASGPTVLQAAYDEHFAAGHIAYAKAGMGVESAARNTLLLRNLVVGLHAERVYITGYSMGANVVMALLEQHPGAFAGGFAGCGVTDGWESQMGHLYDMRAAYNVLTAGTDYALPGNRDVTASAFSMDVPADFPGTGDQFALQQSARLLMPVIALLKAAEANKNGKEARIVRQLTAIGGFPADPASLVYPLVVVGLGADDLRATFGGQIYGNRGKVYRVPEMTPHEAARFNRQIQRFAAKPAAVALARRWHQVRGTFRDPLVTLHARLDPLVPYSQALALASSARRSGAAVHLVQNLAPDTREPLPLGGLDGYVHCGFSKQQAGDLLLSLQRWAHTGIRPAATAGRKL